MVLVEKEEEIIPTAKPFFYEAKGDKVVLLIHGFTDTPFYLRELGKYLALRSLSAYGVRLPGHGTNLENFAKCIYPDWQEAVFSAYQELVRRYQSVFLIGSSFGGNLAIDLSSRHKRGIAKIVTIGTPLRFYFQRLSNFLLPLAKRIMKYHKKSWVAKKKNDQQIDGEGIYNKIPLKTLQQFITFVNKYTTKELPLIKLPVLVIHSKKDVVIPPKSAQIIYDHLGSKEKELWWLEKSYHDPLVDYPNEELFEKIYRFLIE